MLLLVHNITSISDGDIAYLGTQATIKLTIIDDDVADILFVLGQYQLRVMSSAIVEAGDATSFGVQLLSEPTSPVNVTLVPHPSYHCRQAFIGYPTEAMPQFRLSTSTLMFNETNWNAEQRVQAIVLDDFWALPSCRIEIRLNTSTEDAEYSREDFWAVNGAQTLGLIDVADNDVAGFELSSQSLSVQESATGSQTSTWEVTLTSRPVSASPVFVSTAYRASGGGPVRPYPAVEGHTNGSTWIRFDRGNWNSSHVVTLTVEYDSTPYPVAHYTLMHMLSSDDVSFNQSTDIKERPLSITVLDADKAAQLPTMVVSIVEGVLSEADAGAMLSYSLPPMLFSRGLSCPRTTWETILYNQDRLAEHVDAGQGVAIHT